MAWPALQQVGGYTDRRAEVRRLADPVIEALEQQLGATPLDDEAGASVTGWSDVEQRLADMKSELTRAHSLDDYQDVGRRCREIVPAAVNVVFADELVRAGETVLLPAMQDGGSTQSWPSGSRARTTMNSEHSSGSF
jgi:hypothetical protein